jgi:phage shock protein PspC (stress-responsive transcriptional regulator)
MSDQDTTQQLPPAEPPPERARRLLRTRNDRVIAGVAGGLGRYFKVDPVIVRIAFAVSVFFGGLGAFAYIALALFVPTAPGEDGEVGAPPIERSRGLAIGVGIGLVVIALSWGILDGPLWGHGFFLSPALFVVALVAGAILIARRAGGGIGARGALATALLAFAAFIGLSIAAVAAAWAGATGHGVVVALVVIAIGAMLVLAAFNGGARWLIAPAIALAVPLGAVAAADVSFGDGIGERQYRPLSIAALPADGYELGIGRLEVDLRQLDWTDSTVVDLDLNLGIGEAIVAVPSNVCVTTDFDTRAGDLRVAGDEAGGIDVHSGANAGATTTPRLDLNGEVDLGELRVINDDTAEIDGHGPGFHFGGRDDEMRAAMVAACTPPPPDQGVTKPDRQAKPGRKAGGG